MERMFYYPQRGLTTPPPHLHAVEEVRFASPDGTRLHGWFVPTETGPPEAAATIIHVHGNAGNLEDHIGFTEYLPPAGFNLFIFDYRGYGQSEGSARKRRDLIADAHAALDVVLERPDVDPDRIGLFAQSLGGSIGLNVMADRPEIRAAVVLSAFTSWREMAASAVGGEPPSWIGRSLAKLFIPDDARPVDAIGRIDRPLLLIHGDADRIVPVAHGRRLAGAASEQTRYVEIPGGDHNDLRWTSPEVDELTIDFFRSRLPASADVDQAP
ncbi:MAG: alpha/beta fold hydrolase [Phycisphaerales bacterium]|nr:MAG: alpha/beta fold hydrolase [Phycisphaerales bacterium]